MKNQHKTIKLEKSVYHNNMSDVCVDKISQVHIC